MTPAKVEAPESCPHCGMNRTVFAHSRMLVTYEDSAVVGTCSLHCAATELGMSKGKPVKTVLVADYANKQKLVEAKTATWVLGGSQKGVMTKEPKWAFEKKQEAEMFIQMNGGKLATYAEVLELAAHEPKH
jgi:nitrous oxide reductase accessory protein NosL